MNSTPPTRRPARKGEAGYILLTLMLFVALLVVAAAAIAPELAFQVKRDREEEMIHRGVQYSRAVRRYYKKFGRYPTRVEELENTNNMRFLRKRYKDPITREDFKLLHVGEVQMAFGAGIQGAVPVGAMNGARGGTQGQQMMGQQIMAQQAMAQQQALASQQMMGAQQGSSPFGTNSDSSSNSASGQRKSSSGTKGKTNPTFGGGPIVGVVSTSKDETIRVFNNKNHYNEWQFIYDPSSDRGGLLNTPNQKPLQNAVGGLQQPQQGGPGAGFGMPQQPPVQQQPQQQAPQQPQPPEEQ